MNPERFEEHSPGVTLDEDGRVAVHDSDGTEFRYVLGRNTYQQGTHSLKLKLEMFTDNFCVFVGIGKGDVVQLQDDPYAGTYGWGLGLNGTEWKDGSYEDKPELNGRVRQGETVKLVLELDCDVPNLSLHLPNGQQFRIEIPKSETGWKLHVNLFNENAKMRLVNE
ncbi:Hypothetical predicted protein [Paramuricea clavata]|uniref:Uncharacterized protein n=1 Tax=Paramuricea clavata TaxID=317549 RepID=A0A7D9DA82_PARCT|nr:Hypothetical predicted protein [Paramuricea clavata]